MRKNSLDRNTQTWHPVFAWLENPTETCSLSPCVILYTRPAAKRAYSGIVISPVYLVIVFRRETSTGHKITGGPFNLTVGFMAGAICYPLYMGMEAFTNLFILAIASLAAFLAMALAWTHQKGKEKEREAEKNHYDPTPPDEYP